MNRAALQEGICKTPLTTSAKAKPSPSLSFEFWGAVREMAPCKTKVWIPWRSKLFTQACGWGFPEGDTLMCVKQGGLQLEAVQAFKTFLTIVQVPYWFLPFLLSLHLPPPPYPIIYDCPEYLTEKRRKKEKDLTQRKGPGARCSHQHLESFLLVTHCQPFSSGQWSKSFVGHVTICFENGTFIFTFC